MAVEIKFISASAPGGGDGSSGSPWTLAEGVAKAKANRVIKIRPGNYAPTATLNVAVDATAPNGASPCIFAAVDGSDNFVTTPADMVRLDFSGLASGAGWNAGSVAHAFVHGLRFDNAPSDGFTCAASAYMYAALTMCSASGNTGAGFNLARAVIAIDCKAANNAGGGFKREHWTDLSGCFSSGNSGAGGVSGASGPLYNCAVTDGVNSNVTLLPLLAVNCLLTGAGISSGNAEAGGYCSVFSEMAAALSPDGVMDLFNDFYNVGSPAATDTFLSAERQSVNPQLQNAVEARAGALRDRGFPLTGMKTRAGAWQGQAFKSSGVFGSIR